MFFCLDMKGKLDGVKVSVEKVCFKLGLLWIGLKFFGFKLVIFVLGLVGLIG